jgi:hypothetical protein
MFSTVFTNSGCWIRFWASRHKICFSKSQFNIFLACMQSYCTWNLPPEFSNWSSVCMCRLPHVSYTSTPVRSSCLRYSIKSSRVICDAPDYVTFFILLLIPIFFSDLFSNALSTCWPFATFHNIPDFYDLKLSEAKAREQLLLSVRRYLVEHIYSYAKKCWDTK